MSEHHPRSPHRPSSWVGAWSERRAALTPGRVGLVDATTGREFTYADLDRRADRAARLLSDHGVTAAAGNPDDVGGRVAVVSRNRPELADLFFATGKTGGVLAPLSHRLAAPETAELLEDVDPSLLVVEEPFEGLLEDALAEADLDPAVLSLATDGGSDWTAYGEAVPDDPGPVETATLSMDDAHLFLHTGGSTGTPKETVLTHGGIVWNSVNTITAWGLRDDDLTPMVFPMFHTGGWNVITVPLWHMGGTVVIAREFDPGAVLRVIGERDASVLVAVPAILRMMTHHDRWDGTDLSSLRFVKSGGGPCREDVMDEWFDRGIDLSQGYGLTECGPNNFAMPEDWPPEKADSVGVPNPHVETRIVDDGDPVERGEIGELRIASPHAADRYWHNDEETAAAFGEGTVAPVEGGGGAGSADGADRGWVSTGDLARVDDEGYHYIEGRKKHMFVSGGENVYPAAVEDEIADHPAVAEVVVIPVPDDRWGQVGKAVVELAPDATEADLDVESLRAFLEDRLARFKHPRHLAFVGAMPTSGPSKIDREAVADRFGED